MTMIEPAAPEIVLKPPTRGWWTDERKKLAQALFLEGHSYSQVGQIIGATRNAVCGMLSRAGIYRDGKRVLGERRPRREKRSEARFRPRLDGDLPVVLPPAEPINPASLIELGDNQCRWPCSGEGLATVFCGGETVKDRSYCAGHCRLAYLGTGRMSRAEWERRGRATRKDFMERIKAA